MRQRRSDGMDARSNRATAANHVYRSLLRPPVHQLVARRLSSEGQAFRGGPLLIRGRAASPTRPPSVHQVSSKQPALSLGHSHAVVFGYFNRFQRSHERWQRWMVVLKQDVELLAGVVGGHSIQR